jgi:hypothetical protein
MGHVQLRVFRRLEKKFRGAQGFLGNIVFQVFSPSPSVLSLSRKRIAVYMFIIAIATSD